MKYVEYELFNTFTDYINNNLINYIKNDLSPYNLDYYTI